MKRIISFIMAAVMVVMMLPAVVGAEEVVDNRVVEVSTLEELQKAIADKETEITLVKQIVIDKEVEISSDTQTHISTNDVDDAFVVISGGELVLGKRIIIDSDTSILWANGGNIIIDGAEIYVRDNDCAAAFAGKGSKITMYSGYLASDEGSAVAAEGQGAVVELKGGKIYNSEKSAAPAAYSRGGGRINVNGAVVVSDSAAYALIAANGGTILVSDGNITGKSGAVAAFDTPASMIQIWGGIIDGRVSEKGGIVMVIGGVYTDRNVDNYALVNSNCRIFIDGTNSKFGEHAINLLDGNPDTKLCAHVNDEKLAHVRWIEEEKTAVGYKLTAANDVRDYEKRNPDGWTLFGYVDGKWIALDRVDDRRIITDKNFAEYTFKIDNPKECSEYVLELYNADSEDGLVQLADVELITEGTVVDSEHVCDVFGGGYLFNEEEHWHGCRNHFCYNRYEVEEHNFDSVRDGYKNINTCVDCGYQMTTPLTQGQEAVDNIKNVMKTLSLRKFAVAIDCDEDAVVITNNTNTKKVIDDLGDSALYNFMADVKYSFAAREGYKIVSVTVDGVEVDADDVLIYQIKGNHVIKVVTEEIVVEEAADTAIAE